jgi:hypothetical protein
MTPPEVEAIHEEIRAILSARRALASTLGRLTNDTQNTPQEALKGLVTDLKSLVASGLCTLPAFDLLLRISPEDAIEVLEWRYVSEDVDPDRRSGGYEFDLSAMFTEIVDALGAQHLIGLIRSYVISQKRLDDPRVTRALMEALDLESPEELASALRQNS